MRILPLFFVLCLLASNMSAQYGIEWLNQDAHSHGKLIKSTSDHRIIVCGPFGNDYPSDWVDIVINCYDTLGNLLWRNYFTDTVNGGIEEPFDMVIDSADNIYIAGRMHLSFDGLPITPNALLLKYNSSGNLIWYVQYGDSIGYKGAARRLQLKDNNIYVAGFMTPIAGGTNHSYLAKYDTTGQLIWAKIDTNQFETIGRSVFVDNASTIYLVGTTACCTPGYKMFVSKYDSTGNEIWKTVLYDSAHIYAYTWESAIDDSANIYITAETQDTAFSTAYDCAIAKVDSSGLQQWFYSYTMNLGGMQNWSVAVPGRFEPLRGLFRNGNYYITGFNPPGTGVASDDSLFIFKISQSPSAIVEGTTQSIIRLYPNPASVFFRIYFEPDLSKNKLRIFNPIGAEIYSSENYSNGTSINCSTWRRGLYLAQLSVGDESIYLKIIIN